MCFFNAAENPAFRLEFLPFRMTLTRQEGIYCSPLTPLSYADPHGDHLPFLQLISIRLNGLSILHPVNSENPPHFNFCIFWYSFPTKKNTLLKQRIN